MGSGVVPAGGNSVCGDAGELGWQVPSKHRRIKQRITGPMLFRLLRAAIPQTCSRLVCGEQMRVLSLRQRLQREVLVSLTIRSHLRGDWSSRCDTPAMDTGPNPVIAHAEDVHLCEPQQQVSSFLSFA